MIGFAHGGSLVTFGEVGGESEAALVVLNDAAEAPPPLQHLLRRVLVLHIPFVAQYTLHFCQPTHRFRSRTGFCMLHHSPRSKQAFNKFSTYLIPNLGSARIRIGFK